MPVEEYYSQYGQDKYLDEAIFKGLREGFFLEIGANDGITYSNTFFFERFRGWSGICVEPHPNAHSKLVQNRTCKTINVGVSNIENDLEFVQIEGYAEMLSGLKSKYDKEHLQRIENEIAVHKGGYEIIRIRCKRIETILNENNVSHVDYCSIDIEGGELDALESCNFKDFDIRVLSVENNYYGNKLRKYLAKHNYKLVRTIKCDEIYQKRKFWFSF